MDEGPRIGVFGGTFDPPHRTHLRIAHAARTQARLDKVLFMVSGNPPHKRWEVFADGEDRYAMVRAATDGEPAFEPCRLEIDRDGPSYTADTLRTLAEQYPGARLFLIMGYDSLVDLPRWHEPGEILRRARILAVPRPEPDGPVPESLEGHYELLDFEKSDVSSTGVRRRLMAGDDVSGEVPAAVLRVIAERKLYRERA